MASRNEVLTLFGATPEQIMEKERREQARMVLQQQDPYARLGAALGTGLARLFGGESADVIEARNLQSAKEGIDLTTEEGMREAAKRLQSAGFEERALQILDMADRKATAEQARGLQGQTQVNKEIPVEVPFYDRFNDKMSTKTVMIKVPYQWDPKTKTTTPIFGPEYEEQLKQQAIADAEANIQVEVSPASQSEESLKARDRAMWANTPVDGIMKMTNGTYVRKGADGTPIVVSQEEINAMSGIDNQARVDELGY
jgi:hypothetical protein